MKEIIVVIDFETTGLSPARGARATEVAAVKIHDGEIIETFQSLMNGGAYVPSEIEQLTGITNSMIRKAPSSTRIMKELSNFIDGAPLVAHNARFDRTFMEAEYAHARIVSVPSFACTMKLARRIYPTAPNFRLQSILEFADIPHQRKFHRALADATATAQLWLQIQRDLCSCHRLKYVSHRQLVLLGNTPLASIGMRIEEWR